MSGIRKNMALVVSNKNFKDYTVYTVDRLRDIRSGSIKRAIKRNDKCFKWELICERVESQCSIHQRALNGIGLCIFVRDVRRGKIYRSYLRHIPAITEHRLCRLGIHSTTLNNDVMEECVSKRQNEKRKI